MGGKARKKRTFDQGYDRSSADNEAAENKVSRTGPERRGRKKKTKDMPRRPLSAYNMFFRKKRLTLLSKVQNAPLEESSVFTQMGKLVAQEWKQVSKQDLEHFEQLAREDMKRYQREMEEYRIRQAGKRVEGSQSAEEAVVEEQQQCKPNAQNNVNSSTHPLVATTAAAQKQAIPSTIFTSQHPQQQYAVSPSVNGSVSHLGTWNNSGSNNANHQQPTNFAPVQQYNPQPAGALSQDCINQGMLQLLNHLISQALQPTNQAMANNPGTCTQTTHGSSTTSIYPLPPIQGPPNQPTVDLTSLLGKNELPISSSALPRQESTGLKVNNHTHLEAAPQQQQADLSTAVKELLRQMSRR